MSCSMQAIEQVISPYQFHHSAFAESLPASAADQLRRVITRLPVKKGEILFRQSSYARGVYLLECGKVKVYQEKTAGQRRIIHIYGNGDLLGYRPLFTDDIHSFTAEALEPCMVQFIPKDAFSALVAESPSFAQFMLKAISKEFAAWSNFQAAFESSPVRSRVALVMLILHEKYRLPGNTTAVIQFTRTDLAEYVGASLETVVRTLRDLKESGVVHIRGRRMLVNDVESLLALASSALGLPNARLAAQA